MDNAITRIVIVGGGTAGWMSAALISKLLGKLVSIVLVESEEIGRIGVGEATIPPVRHVNEVLGIDEADFLRETKATIKLAIQFEGWHQPDHHYLHAFGTLGKSIAFCPFHHYWLRAVKAGFTTNLWDYSLNYHCAQENKFAPINTRDSNLELLYAYHFDAGLYAQYLRSYSEKCGVMRVEGLIEHVHRDTDSGDINHLVLKDGRVIGGDLFIDCSGMRGLLIRNTLGVGFEDWSHWLPCDRAIAVPSERFATTLPYTRAIAHPMGWQWRIPLQHRNGNGLVYCSHYCSDDEAVHWLLSRLESAALAEPSVIRFKTGRCVAPWSHNVIAIGLSSGFLEPLESTSIHLIQSAIVRLIKLFPQREINPADMAEYNRQSAIEFEQIRDFIILHYFLNARHDAFWRDLRAMDIPASLAHKMNLFQASGRLFREQDDLFSESSWLQVMIGQGLMPHDYHPLANHLSEQQLTGMLANLKTIKRSPLAKMPDHDNFLMAVCKRPS